MTRRTPALAAMTTALLLTTTAATAQDAEVTATVVHAIPDTIADVYVDDQLVLDDLEPGVTDPVTLPAGEHVVALAAPDAPDASDPLQTATLTLAAGSNVSLVAHLDEAGDVQLTAYTNDVSPIRAGDARLAVRHVAATGAINVGADGDAMGTLESGTEWGGEMAAGGHDLTLEPVGVSDAAVQLPDAELAADTLTIAYGIGSPPSGSFDVLVQQVVGLQEADSPSPEPSASPTATDTSPPTDDEATPAGEDAETGPEEPPTSVPAGTGGLVDDGRPTGAILALLVLAGVALVTRRRLDTSRS